MVQFKCDICGREIIPRKFDRLHIIHSGSVCTEDPKEEPEDWVHLDLCGKCHFDIKQFIDRKKNSYLQNSVPTFDPDMMTKLMDIEEDDK